MKRFILASTVFLLFVIIILPAVTQKSSQHMGNADLPDTRFYYSLDELYSTAESLNESGRSYYVRQRITFDLVWPLVYAWFFYTGILVVFNHFQPSSITNTVRWFPILALIFDYLENGLASVVMLIYPERIDTLARLLPFATLLKWCLIGLSFIVLVSGSLIKFISFSRKREREKWAKENQE